MKKNQITKIKPAIELTTIENNVISLHCQKKKIATIFKILNKQLIFNMSAAAIFYIIVCTQIKYGYINDSKIIGINCRALIDGSNFTAGERPVLTTAYLPYLQKLGITGFFVQQKMV